VFDNTIVAAAKTTMLISHFISFAP